MGSAQRGRVTGIGSARSAPCSGNPHRPGATVNDCPEPATRVVIGAIEDEYGHPHVVCISACDRHVLGVRKLLQGWEQFTGEPVMVTSLAAFREHVEGQVDG